MRDIYSGAYISRNPRHIPTSYNFIQIYTDFIPCFFGISLINITINGIKLKQRDHFKYLGALVSSDGRNNTEISARIAQAKMTFQKMKTVLTNPHISIHTRKRTLECYIEPILMYGCEAWTISKQPQKKLEAVEMWFLRRVMKI